MTVLCIKDKEVLHNGQDGLKGLAAHYVLLCLSFYFVLLFLARYLCLLILSRYSIVILTPLFPIHNDYVIFSYQGRH